MFAISGAAHALFSWKLGQTCGLAMDFWFYMVDFVGLVFEVSVGSLSVLVTTHFLSKDGLFKEVGKS